MNVTLLVNPAARSGAHTGTVDRARLVAAIAAVLLFVGAPASPEPPLQAEKHLANIRQLTHGGENAEATEARGGQ